MAERERVPSPKVVAEGDWLSQRKALLEQEKELTRQLDRVNAARRRLPMVKIEKQYTFEGPRGKVGLIELAHTGTLLLDEVGDLPRALQVKLLRFLEAGEVWPVGASKAKRPDVRIVAATNCDLRQMIADGTFRRDLYYRLHVLSICIPPLRDRRDDIPWLVAVMLDQLERKLGLRKRIAPEALDEISGSSHAQPFAPLADWRARAMPPCADEALVPVPSDPTDPATLGALVERAVPGLQPALRAQRREGACVRRLPEAVEQLVG